MCGLDYDKQRKQSPTALSAAAITARCHNGRRQRRRGRRHCDLPAVPAILCAGAGMDAPPVPSRVASPGCMWDLGFHLGPEL